MENLILGREIKEYIQVAQNSFNDENKDLSMLDRNEKMF